MNISTDSIYNEEDPLNELSWVVLDTTCALEPSTAGLFDSARQYWFLFWTDVFKANNSTSTPDFNDFDSTNYISLLIDREWRIVAMLLHSLLDLCSPQLPRYLEGPGGEVFLIYARSKGYGRAMSVEFLAVDVAWRKAKVALSLGHVMFDLAARLQTELRADGSFFRARQDLRVADAAVAIGGEVLQADIDMHNTPVSLICLPTSAVRDHSCARVRALSTRLWDNRREQTKNQRRLPTEYPNVA